MKFTELKLKGAYLIEAGELKDGRGVFYRQFCRRELQNAGIDFEICQCSVSKNNKTGTLRGLHFQTEPFAEKKLVTCMNGAMFDVIVDIREDSPTYLQWESIELNGNDTKVLYIPKGFAHGFQTLQDNTLVYYQMENYFAPDACKGFKWNDPKLGIQWPDEINRTINDRDNSYELL